MVRYYLRGYPVTLFLVVCIILLSLLPLPDVQMQMHVPLADKWTHMLMYGVLTLTFWLEYARGHRQRSVLHLLVLGMAAPVAMGGLLELAQAYLTTCRSGEWLDFVANSIGVGVGSIMGLLCLPRVTHS